MEGSLYKQCETNLNVYQKLGGFAGFVSVCWRCFTSHPGGRVVKDTRKFWVSESFQYSWMRGETSSTNWNKSRCLRYSSYSYHENLHTNIWSSFASIFVSTNYWEMPDSGQQLDFNFWVVNNEFIRAFFFFFFFNSFFTENSCLLLLE